MRTSDPALPRIGTDFMTLRVVMCTSNPALPRIGTDFMTLRVVMCTSNPALPRIGTDFMTCKFDDYARDLLVCVCFPRADDKS